MKRYSVWGVLLFCVSLSQAFADDDLSMTVWGYGTAQCHQWTESNAGDELDSGIGTWVLGKITGIEKVCLVMRKHSCLDKTIQKSDQITERVKLWCVDHPDDDVDTASDQVWFEISKPHHDSTE